jgi:secreted trypsin-like serine protease
MTYRLLKLLTLIVILAIILPTVANAAPVAVRNGADAPQDQYPWMVGIALADIEDSYTAQFCGGTLIDAEWVLTAAHCTYDLNDEPFTVDELNVIIGRNRLSSNKGERVRIDQIIRHESYQPATLMGDIALLHLSKSVEITPLNLFRRQADLELNPVTATIIGWGITTDGSGADTLQEAQVPLVAHDACRSFYYSYGVPIYSTMLCAGDATGRVDASLGDSGGPLVIWQAESQRWMQIGIISWGVDDSIATSGAYGVYTDIAGFIDWIYSHTGLAVSG